MPSKYVVTEAAPSTTSYVRCGRGGAGNVFRTAASSSKIASTSTTITSSSPSSASPGLRPTRRFFSGIGGAGNAHSTARLPSVADSLDDAVRHATARDNAAVGYCGRGGAGNVYRRKSSDAASSYSSSSASSAASVKSSMSSSAKLWDRVSGAFNRE
ncbi:hypothetical protein AAL_00780 [Moelleriella libera RCEF 2490]|uniref:Uncharacterized protein n=1 Tax=Moelleriella libera RCEF 2490 TaxID=1081109 RepID=A0A166RQK1_9HYPO|nr:hypothetical protein AAL_00780 [Moelleriella libera RCEF 2490]